MVNNGIRLLILVIALGTIAMSSCKKDENTDNPPSTNINYKQEMRLFVEHISSYAKGINANFFIVPQNGVELVSNTGDNDGSPEINYINAIDGIGREDLYYGYNADDYPTPTEDTQWMEFFLDMAKNNGNVKILVTDYCSTHYKVDDSYTKNDEKGYVSFAASHRELDNIPDYPMPIHNENTDSIINLQQVKNFLYLINPDNLFTSKQTFIDSVRNTNYDLLIMDLFFNGEQFTASEVEALRQKANGGKRLLICYMSIGEAEDYRYYWHSDWTAGNPDFIVKENPEWQGNYLVKYWNNQWQSIIFGNNSSYLYKIISVGFDGVYLDKIDSYEEFEE